MFEQLFKKSFVVARHRSAPFAKERASYLSYCAKCGETKQGIGRKARELIWAAPLLGATPQFGLTIDQLRDLARRRADGRNGHADSTEERFVRNVRSWLRYLGWWHEPTPVSVVDPDEVHEIYRVPISELVDPTHRIGVRHPSGWIGPGFFIGDDKDVILWGFTAGIIARLFDFMGWTTEVTDPPIVDLPDYMLRGQPTRNDIQPNTDFEKRRR